MNLRSRAIKIPNARNAAVYYGKCKVIIKIRFSEKLLELLARNSI